MLMRSFTPPTINDHRDGRYTFVEFTLLYCQPFLLPSCHPIRLCFHCSPMLRIKLAFVITAPITLRDSSSRLCPPPVVISPHTAARLHSQKCMAYFLTSKSKKKGAGTKVSKIAVPYILWELPALSMYYTLVATTSQYKTMRSALFQFVCCTLCYQHRISSPFKGRDVRCYEETYHLLNAICRKTEL